MRLSSLPLAALVFGTTLTNAITLNINSVEEVKDASAKVANWMMDLYEGDQPGGTPGMLPEPYYWWEAGAMWGHMVEYWYYTGDDTYNEQTKQALIFQAGSDARLTPRNQTLIEGNDDQIFWAFAAMSAAEFNFDPPGSDDPSYLTMAIAVFNEQADRWDEDTCGGGLHWQILPQSNGYDYKNTVSNAGFFQLAARLARYTKNETYTEWAEKSWEWFNASSIIRHPDYTVFDGSNITPNNCTIANNVQWSYNYGLWYAGMAYMYNHTEDTKWLTPLNGILEQSLARFYPLTHGGGILVETNCEPTGSCSVDALCFKSLTMRWLAITAQLVPHLRTTLHGLIEASGAGAAGQCTGGPNGDICGSLWNTTVYDGTKGIGQQMSALAAIDANMMRLKDLKAPFTTDNGGKSEGDPSAGSGGDTSLVREIYDEEPVTRADRAGAGILTALVLGGTLVIAYWMCSGPGEMEGGGEKGDEEAKGGKKDIEEMSGGKGEGEESSGEKNERVEESGGDGG